MTHTEALLKFAAGEPALADLIQPDGGLFHGGQYVAWTPGEATICLDADFTAAELEAFARHMRADERLRHE